MSENVSAIIGLDILLPMRNRDVFDVLLFRGINLNNYYFKYVSGEMISDNGIVRFPSSFSIQYFSLMRNLKRSICTLHCTLFPCECEAETIRTYSAFLESSCEMIILYYDWELEIYCKHIDWIENIKKNVDRINGAIISEKTIINDERKEMYC